MPGQKDFVSHSRNVHRILLCNLKELYQKFREVHPNLSIGFSTFAELRPKWSNLHKISIKSQQIIFFIKALLEPLDIPQKKFQTHFQLWQIICRQVIKFLSFLIKFLKNKKNAQKNIFYHKNSSTASRYNLGDDLDPFTAIIDHL